MAKAKGRKGRDDAEVLCLRLPAALARCLDIVAQYQPGRREDIALAMLINGIGMLGALHPETGLPALVQRALLEAFEGGPLRGVQAGLRVGVEATDAAAHDAQERRN